MPVAFGPSLPYSPVTVRCSAARAGVVAEVAKNARRTPPRMSCRPRTPTLWIESTNRDAACLTLSPPWPVASCLAPTLLSQAGPLSWPVACFPLLPCERLASLSQRLGSSDLAYENTVGPGCQGTAGLIGLVVHAYSALGSGKLCTILRLEK